MKRALFTIAALLLLLAPAAGQFNGCRGGFCGSSATPAATYQGPGDVVSGALMWGSCARVYSAAQASTSTSLCDLVAVTGGAAVCTLRGSSTGFVDLAASYCAGTTPSAACAAASGGSCKVTKVYDQAGGTAGWSNVTLGSMPALTFSALNGLPGMTCTNAAGSVLASGNITQAQPFTMSGVYKRTGSFTSRHAVIAIGTGNAQIGGATSADTSDAFAGSSLTRAATDNAFHAINGVMQNTGSGANNTDNSDTTGSNGAGAFSAHTLRFCRTAGAASSDMVVMEAGLWGIGFSGTQRTDMNANQHGTNGYNF